MVCESGWLGPRWSLSGPSNLDESKLANGLSVVLRGCVQTLNRRTDNGREYRPPELRHEATQVIEDKTIRRPEVNGTSARVNR
jgi:hypothetical protein